MERHHKATLASRKRAAARLQKLRGSLKGKPSALHFLLNERHSNLQNEERRLKGKRG